MKTRAYQLEQDLKLCHGKQLKFVYYQFCSGAKLLYSFLKYKWLLESESFQGHRMLISTPYPKCAVVASDCIALEVHMSVSRAIEVVKLMLFFPSSKSFRISELLIGVDS